MNYIKEIKAFYDLVQVKQLSTGQIALWHALMQINNKCAWIEWFTAPNLTLELTSGLSRKGIYKARNILKQYGIIDFKSNGTKATSYKLLSLQHNTQESTQVKGTLPYSTQVGTQGSTQDSTQGGTQSSATLTKLNETKLNETKTTSSSGDCDEKLAIIANAFEQNGLGTINSTIKESLIDLLDSYSTEWIIAAMRIAVESNKRNLKYVRGILSNWNRDGGMKLGGNKNGKHRGNDREHNDEYAGLGFTFEDVQEM